MCVCVGGGACAVPCAALGQYCEAVAAQNRLKSIILHSKCMIMWLPTHQSSILHTRVVGRISQRQYACTCVTRGCPHITAALCRHMVRTSEEYCMHMHMQLWLSVHQSSIPHACLPVCLAG